MNYTALIGDPGGSGSHGLTRGHPVSGEGCGGDTIAVSSERTVTDRIMSEIGTFGSQV